MNIAYLFVPLLIALIGLPIGWLSLRRVLSLWSKPFGIARKAVEGTVLSLVALTALVLAASAALNAALFVSFRHNPSGAFYEANGRRMRLDCTGSGSPTLVTESGLGYGGLGWSGVQPLLSRTTRVCSYDRAGIGWSDSAPAPRDADHIADELHGLLAAAHIDGPIVLMGHSLGGIYIRDYAVRYPAQIAGLILLDSSIPLQDRLGVATPSPPKVLVQAALSTGILHWALRLTYPQAPALAIADSAYLNLETASDELASFDRSGEEAARTSSYGALPILIFSHDPAKDATDMLLFDRMQGDLLKLSSRSRRIVAKGSGHVIQFDRPQLIEKETSLFIAQLRGAAPPAAQYGTTVTE